MIVREPEFLEPVSNPIVQMGRSLLLMWRETGRAFLVTLAGFANFLNAFSRRNRAEVAYQLFFTGIRSLGVITVVALFTIAAFGAEMTISPSWAFCMDIGGKKSGAISGAMNMLGNLGSFVSANLFPVLGPAYFPLVMLLNLYSAVAWYFMRPRDEAPVG